MFVNFARRVARARYQIANVTMAKVCISKKYKIRIYYIRNCRYFIEYNQFGNFCQHCPFGTIGDYPKCECLDGGYFNGEYCVHCPFNANGSYPQCTCNDGATYIEKTNLCEQCPSNR